jgi:hypothetical protein
MGFFKDVKFFTEHGKIGVFLTKIIILCCGILQMLYAGSKPNIGKETKIISRPQFLTMICFYVSNRDHGRRCLDV